MAFSASAINYATQYGQGLLQMYPYVLHFGALYATPNNGRYRWVNSRTIEVPKISTSGRINSDRDTVGTKARRYNNSWTPLTLSNERMWETLVHPQDIDQTNKVASIENITTTFNNEQKFPEMDAYCISKLYADFLATGRHPDSAVLTTSNVLTLFDTLMERQTEKRVPASGRLCYITPAVDTLIKNATQISRTMDVKNMSPAISRAISYLDTVSFEVVPSELMLTAYDFTEGWAAGVSAKQIQMCLVSPLAVITPVSYEFAMLDKPSAGSGGKWDYYEESHEDVFLLPRREYSIDFVIEDVTALGTLTITSVDGTEVGDTKVTVTTAKTAGSTYMYKTNSANSFTFPGYGDEIPSGWTEFTSGEDYTLTTGHYIAVVELDADGKAFKGGSVIVDSKAGT